MNVFEVQKNNLYYDVDIPTVSKVICGDNSTFKRRCLEEILSNPISDTQLLRQRQGILRKVIRSTTTIDEDGEKSVAWLLNCNLDEELMEILEIPFFKSFTTRLFNRVWPLLGINNSYGIVLAPLLAIFSPVMYVLVPFLYMRFKYGIKIGITTFLNLLYQTFRVGGDVIALTSGKTFSLSAILVSIVSTIYVYVQTILNSLKFAQSLHLACQKICQHIEAACRYSKQVTEAMKECNWEVQDSMCFVTNVCESGLPHSLSGFKYRCFDPRLGIPLSVFNRLDLKKLKGFARHSGVFEAIRCASRSMTCFAEFNGPGIVARGVYHPSIESCVKNDVVLVPDTPNIVLTGANASGKSSILRGIALSVLMSQTLTVAYCEAIAINPVEDITTHMCVPDDITQGLSRFQAEMNNITETITKAETGISCLMVIDELFSSTSSDQSLICLDSFVRRMSSYKKCMFILATHHPITFDNIRRFKMVTSPVTLSHTYKMVQGTNEVKNAHLLLKTENSPLQRRVMTSTSRE